MGDAQELDRLHLLEAASRKYLLTWEELRMRNLHLDFLVEGFIPKSSIAMLTGSPGSGKSWIAFDLLRAAVTGTSWLGLLPPIGTASNVILCNYDNPAPVIADRFKNFQLDDLAGRRLHIHMADFAPNELILPDAADDLALMVEHHNASIVVFDSFRQAHYADEQSSQEMATVMKGLKRIRDMGALVIVVHHSSKGGEDSRGSSEIDGSTDVRILVEPGRLTWRKTRGWAMEKTVFKWKMDKDSNRPVLCEQINAPPPWEEVTFVKEIAPSLEKYGRVTVKQFRGFVPELDTEKISQVIEFACGQGWVARNLSAGRWQKAKSIYLTSGWTTRARS